MVFLEAKIFYNPTPKCCGTGPRVWCRISSAVRTHSSRRYTTGMPTATNRVTRTLTKLWGPGAEPKIPGSLETYIKWPEVNSAGSYWARPKYASSLSNMDRLLCRCIYRRPPLNSERVIPGHQYMVDDTGPLAQVSSKR